MFNRIILVGNLTKDPESRFTPGGTAIATLNLAVNEKVKKGQEWVDDVLYIGVVVFGKQGEAATKYLSKGKPVLVEGRLQEQRWEKDGVKKSKMQVIASTVRFLSKNEARPESTGSPDAPPADEYPSDVEPF